MQGDLISRSALIEIFSKNSICDTLQAIQDWNEKLPTEEQVKDYMTLCKDLVCNMVKPYNFDYAFDEKFTEIAK